MDEFVLGLGFGIGIGMIVQIIWDGLREHFKREIEEDLNKLGGSDEK